MRYRSFEDRKISAYAAILLITILAGSATLFIVHQIFSLDFTQTAALDQSGLAL